jgi:hypothetical protein
LANLNLPAGAGSASAGFSLSVLPAAQAAYHLLLNSGALIPNSSNS